MRIAVLLVAPFLLSGCAALLAVGSALGTAGATYQAVQFWSGAADDAIQAACTSYETIHGAANAAVAGGKMTAGDATKAQIIEEYVDAACAHPPGANPIGTAVWIGVNGGEIAALAAGEKP